MPARSLITVLLAGGSIAAAPATALAAPSTDPVTVCVSARITVNGEDVVNESDCVPPEQPDATG